MRISATVLSGNGQAGRVVPAMAKGAKRLGWHVDVRSEREQNMEGYDALVLWGFVTPCQEIIANAKKLGIPWVFLDFGYWCRDTHYKVAVNDRHGNAYFRRNWHSPKRWESFNVNIMPNQIPPAGGGILLAGMSSKASWSWGYKDHEYELKILNEIKKHTDRKVYFRPKNATYALPGTEADRSRSIGEALTKYHAVVVHHSNVGSDAIVAGVSCFAHKGIAANILPSHSNLALLEDAPVISLEERQNWAYDAAYCQWSLDEMSDGRCWQFLKDEGLLEKCPTTNIAPTAAE